MRVEDFVYPLPQKRITRRPYRARTQSRLMVLNADTQRVEHRLFHSFIDLLNPRDLLVLNNTKVFQGRIQGNLAMGDRVEIFVERVLGFHNFLARIQSRKPLKPKTLISVSSKETLEVLNADPSGLFHCRSLKGQISEVIERCGQHPFSRPGGESIDKKRYQTIYAQQEGAMIAPTAGLHFDEVLLQEIKHKGVGVETLTLHVGVGSNQPVRVEQIQDYQLDSEWVSVSSELCRRIEETQSQGGRVIAVGTTVVRALECIARKSRLESFEGEVDLFIYPGFEFQKVDALVTNLHLPGSTDLMLVSAFIGRENALRLYKLAVENRYRFYNYGDAMFLSRANSTH